MYIYTPIITYSCIYFYVYMHIYIYIYIYMPFKAPTPRPPMPPRLPKHPSTTAPHAASNSMLRPSGQMNMARPAVARFCATCAPPSVATMAS